MPHATPPKSLYRTRGKRLFDLLVAVPALVLLSPVLLLIAVLVRIKLGGPVIFSQQRPGLNGRLFEIHKFRTMTDARDPAGNLLPDQQRLTRFGALLRSTSLDELPELWNVVVGEMSLVGPRPLLAQYLDRYSPWQARRHEVRPGITGLAQVNGRNNLEWEEKFELDVWYVENCSFVLDINTLLLTPLRVVQRDGINRSGHATAPEFMGAVAKEMGTPPDAAGDGVIVLGAGGHAKVVISTLQAAGHRVVAAFADDVTLHGHDVLGVPVRGTLADLRTYRGANAVIAMGDCQLRQQVTGRFDLNWLTVIHPTAWVHESVTLGPGTVVCAGAVIQPDCRIGSHVIVNTAASVDHDCDVGDYVHLGPGVNLAGQVRIAERAFLGTGSSVIPGVAVGAGTTVGAGAVVTDDLPNDVVATGCPAKVKRSIHVKPHAA